MTEGPTQHMPPPPSTMLDLRELPGPAVPHAERAGTAAADQRRVVGIRQGIGPAAGLCCRQGALQLVRASRPGDD